MAIECRLIITTEANQEEVRTALSTIGGFQRCKDRADQFEAPGLPAVAVLVESEIGQSVIKEALGFAPNICVLFRLDKFEEYEAGLHNTLRATNEILIRWPGDAVLLMGDGDSLLLLRTHGQLILNNKHQFWDDNPSCRQWITLAYEVKELDDVRF